MGRPGNNLLCFRRGAFGDRLLLAPLLAFIVIAQERAFGAGDLAAAVAIGLETVFADQRADPRRLQLDRIERIGAGQPGVEFGLGIAVEQRERTLRRGIPVTVGCTRKAADAAQFSLHRFGDIGLRRPGVQGCKVHLLVLVGGCRSGRRLVGRERFGRGAFLLGSGGLILGNLLGFLGRKARLLGGPGVGVSLGLLHLLRPFGNEPRALLFGQPCLFGGDDPGFLGGNLLYLMAS